jgi:transposase
MVAVSDTFAQWLAQAHIPEHVLTSEQAALLRAAFCFRQSRGHDYYSTRLLSHFLLHCDTGLKVAQLARLVGVSRPTASRQQGLSSKQTVQQAHHRMDGRPYGKLLPRYAGPIAQFLLTHPDTTRADLIDFVDRTWGVRVSRIALYHFLKKFGLDEATRQAAAEPTPRRADAAEPAPRRPDAADLATSAPPATVLPPPPPFAPQSQPASTPAPPFSARARSTRVPSS